MSRILKSRLGYRSALLFAVVMIAVCASTAHAGLRGRNSPEIDPGSIASAITLFAGGTMYLSSKRRVK